MTLFKHLFIFSLLLFGSVNLHAGANSCVRYNKSTVLQSEARNLEKYLDGPLGTSMDSVVQTVGSRHCKVIFAKDKDAK